MRQIETNEIKQSMQSLVEIMPITVKQLFDDQEDDKYGTQFRECKVYSIFLNLLTFKDSI